MKGSRWVVLGNTLACFLSGFHCVNRAPCMSWRAGGGSETMVAGGAHHAKDLPLVEEDLVQPLHVGFPKALPA